MEKQIIINQSFYSWLKILVLGLSLMNLAGCAVHKASFDCSNGKGMGCGSMTDVHKAIKDNSFATEVESRNQTKPIAVCSSCQKTNPANISKPIQIIEHDDLNINPNDNVVSRSEDQVMRIWFNSYFDENNNFHDSQYIYTIIQPAQWLVNKRDAGAL